MSYRRAETVLPKEIIEMIQQYVDGESIYIPRKDGMRNEWGRKTKFREELRARDREIYEEYLEGQTTAQLAEKYCLSIKSIQRIIKQKKKTPIKTPIMGCP